MASLPRPLAEPGAEAALAADPSMATLEMLPTARLPPLVEPEAPVPLCL